MPKNYSHEENLKKKIKLKKRDKAEVLNMSYPRESNIHTFHLTTVELLPRRTKES